ncbi:MAG: hypothetical protein RLZZ233_2053, partial [Verrucomicrobiota bacterium]
MSPRLAVLIGLLIAGHSPSSLAAAGAAESALVFNTTAPKNDLKGDFEAQVLFAQSQIIPARPREDDRQPRLISLRKTLLMVRPLRADATPISVTVLDGAGKVLGTAKMSPPALLPKTAYFIDAAPSGVLDFKPKGNSL